MGSEAALDPHPHIGPPDLDRHMVDEWRDSLVSIHPMGQDGEGINPTSPSFAQRGKEAAPRPLPPGRGYCPCTAHSPGHNHCCCGRHK